jgi:hypothetical protein
MQYLFFFRVRLSAVAGDEHNLSASLLSSGWYTLRTHCDTLRKFNEQ